MIGVDITAPHTAEVIVPAMAMLVRRFMEEHPGQSPSFSSRVSDGMLSIEVMPIHPNRPGGGRPKYG